MSIRRFSLSIFLSAGFLLSCTPGIAQQVIAGARTVMDAHNCYPYYEWWGDRIDRALATGTPLAIEQDLAWYTDAKSGRSRSVVTHGEFLTGEEPTMEQYFFERVRPVIEKALQDKTHRGWPLITLNLDFKDNQPEHLAAVLTLLQKYQPWLTTAVKSAVPTVVSPFEVKPILVLTGEADEQQRVFYDQLPAGARILLFGAVHSDDSDPTISPEMLDREKASDYRRWWNNSWRVVEPAGQQHAGEWTTEKAQRLQSLVTHAHANGLLIRFYTLDGASRQELSSHGWFRDYDFGSLSAVRLRWRAAIAAGVDYLASDQYEQLASEIQRKSRVNAMTSHDAQTSYRESQAMAASR